jgi:hypothetical protein
VQHRARAPLPSLLGTITMTVHAEATYAEVFPVQLLSGSKPLTPSRPPTEIPRARSVSVCQVTRVSVYLSPTRESSPCHPTVHRSRSAQAL